MNIHNYAVHISLSVPKLYSLQHICTYVKHICGYACMIYAIWVYLQTTYMYIHTYIHTEELCSVHTYVSYIYVCTPRYIRMYIPREAVVNILVNRKLGWSSHVH